MKGELFSPHSQR